MLPLWPQGLLTRREGVPTSKEVDSLTFPEFNYLSRRAGISLDVRFRSDVAKKSGTCLPAASQ